MKVSVINVNLVAEDAIGKCIIDQVHFFSRRGDDVQVYVQYAPEHVPAAVTALTRVVTLKDLIGGAVEHFRLSDLYVYHYPGHYDLMESIRGIERGTVVFYYHNVTPPGLWGSEQDRDLLIRGVEGSGLAHYADVCITPSPFNKQDLVDRIGCAADRVFVLPLAVSLDQFAPGDRDPALVERYGVEGQRVLLFVGRMAGNKRIDLLIEALAELKQPFPDTRLLLVGDDRSAPAFREIVAGARARAEELGVAQDVVWTGRVEDLPAYYRLADVYVTASLHEGFGVPLIEAMASGVPVVASRAGAMPWTLGEAGLLCEPGDAHDLAEKVRSLLEDDGLRGSLIVRGLERARAFTLEQYELRLGEILDGAMTYTLPEAAGDEPRAHDVLAAASVEREGMLLDLLAGEIDGKSDIALHKYVVRSHLPLFGPVIAWLRVNLTSHLREPYLDPMIERQVDLNRRLAEWLRRAARAWNSSAQRQAQLEARVQTLEAEVHALRRQLEEAGSASDAGARPAKRGGSDE
jgi:glycosyltransferase involved in cell wall biosynthesis